MNQSASGIMGRRVCVLTLSLLIDCRDLSGVLFDFWARCGKCCRLPSQGGSAGSLIDLNKFSPYWHEKCITCHLLLQNYNKNGTEIWLAIRWRSFLLVLLATLHLSLMTIKVCKESNAASLRYLLSGLLLKN